MQNKNEITSDTAEFIRQVHAAERLDAQREARAPKRTQQELNPLYIHDSQRQSQRFVVMVITALYEGQVLRFTSFRNSDPLVKKIKKMATEIGKFYGKESLPLLISIKKEYTEVKKGLTEVQKRGILEANAENYPHEQANPQEHSVSIHQGHDEGIDDSSRSNDRDDGTEKD